MDATVDPVSRPGHDALWCWFGLSYASWLTLPRVLMHEMPDEWQAEMAKLLKEYEEHFPGGSRAAGVAGTRVQCTGDRGQLVRTPRALTSYRRPERRFIEDARMAGG